MNRVSGLRLIGNACVRLKFNGREEEKMKAAYYSGNQTFSVEVDSPKEPEAGEVRLKIGYCGICGTDMHVYHGAMDTRVTTHRVIGHECSAVVDKVGEGVIGFAKGDPQPRVVASRFRKLHWLNGKIDLASSRNLSRV